MSVGILRSVKVGTHPKGHMWNVWASSKQFGA